MNRKPPLNSTVRFLIFLTILTALWFLAKLLHFDVDAARQWLGRYPLGLSAALFIVLYVGLTSLLWFGTIDFFRISGALLFGPYWGTLFIWIAEIFNAAILFTVSRKLGQEFVLQKFGVQAKDIDYSKNQKGFWSAFVLRINLLVPFRFMDLGFGLSKISFRKYILAVITGSPLRIFIVQFIIAGVGEAFLKDPTAMYHYLMANQGVLFWSAAYLFAVFVITLVAVVKAMPKWKKKA